MVIGNDHLCIQLQYRLNINYALANVVFQPLRTLQCCIKRNIALSVFKTKARNFYTVKKTIITNLLNATIEELSIFFSDLCFRTMNDREFELRSSRYR